MIDPTILRRPRCPECAGGTVIETGTAFYSAPVSGWSKDEPTLYGVIFGNAKFTDFSDLNRVYECKSCGYDSADVRDFFRYGVVTPGAAYDDPAVVV